MPEYLYSCVVCPTPATVFMTMAEDHPEAKECPKCRVTALLRVYDSRTVPTISRGAVAFQPHDQLGTVVTSKRQEDALCKEMGLVPLEKGSKSTRKRKEMLDAEWVLKEARKLNSPLDHDDVTAIRQSFGEAAERKKKEKLVKPKGKWAEPSEELKGKKIVTGIQDPTLHRKD